MAKITIDPKTIKERNILIGKFTDNGKDKQAMQDLKRIVDIEKSIFAENLKHSLLGEPLLEAM
jgi:hypothetical protein